MTRFGLYFSFIVAVSFIVREKWSTRRKPPTCRKLLTNLLTYCCFEYTSTDRDSISQH